MASVCDQDGSNVKAVNQLIDPNYDKSPKNKPATGLLQYKIRDTVVIHCWDPPHLIKGTRNNLMTKNLQHRITSRWNVTKTDHHESVLKQPPRSASWKDVVEFYHWSNGGSTKLLRKVTVEHMEPVKEKMKVSTATQVFSQTYGDMMLKHCTNEVLRNKELPKTAEVLLFFNDLFDSVNGSSGSEGSKLKAAVSSRSVHFAFWDYALCMLSKMHFLEVVDTEKKKKTKDSEGKTTKKVMKRRAITTTGTDENKTEKESNRTRNIQNWTSTILGYMEICKKCLDLNITEISLRYFNWNHIFLCLSMGIS